MLVLEDVHVRYGAIAALRGVSLYVNEGEMVGLIGVNGAGKTTTLMTIAGVLKPTQGTITFEGQSIVGHSPEDIVRKGVGWALKENMRSAPKKILPYVKGLRRRGVSSTIILYAIEDLKGAQRQAVLNLKIGSKKKK